MESANPAERLAAALLIPNLLRERLSELDDGQIGQLLLDEVWSRLNLLAPEATVCVAGVDRLCQRMSVSPHRKPFGFRRRSNRSWARVRDQGLHVLNAEVALYRCGIPFLLLPWQRNRFASCTFLVMDVAEARACLAQMGFRETLRRSSVLVHSQTRQPIQLYEDKHNSVDPKPDFSRS